ncbi:MAG TPA: four helix bundle protein [Patescibacteria group bacterium]|nr:four helix bundle protein [Patescibacteria group bacterium]
MGDLKQQIKSFRDLDVYQNSYTAMLTVAKEVLPLLPESEKYDLKDQLSRSTKAIPRLITEGYAKRHQKAGFQKYIDDAMAECNESVVSLEQCRDLYGIDEKLINSLVDIYDKTGRQLYKLGLAWNNFKRPTS